MLKVTCERNLASINHGLADESHALLAICLGVLDIWMIKSA